MIISYQYSRLENTIKKRTAFIFHWQFKYIMRYAMAFMFADLSVNCVNILNAKFQFVGLILIRTIGIMRTYKF